MSVSYLYHLQEWELKTKSCSRGDEELRAVGVGSSIGHGQQHWFLMFEREPLV